MTSYVIQPDGSFQQHEPVTWGLPLEFVLGPNHLLHVGQGITRLMERYFDDVWSTTLQSFEADPLMAVWRLIAAMENRSIALPALPGLRIVYAAWYAQRQTQIQH